MRKKSRFKITGNARFHMMLKTAARKYWRYYGTEYKRVKEESYCIDCKKKVPYVEVDHEPPLGPYPRKSKDWGNYIYHLLYGPQFGRCKKHHLEKTRSERRKS